jgi:hypothetical protein
MALGRYKTFTDGSVLTAAELNGVQDHITGNAATLISPFTQTLNANNNQITNLVIETVSATPSATPEGRMVYHTTLDQLQVMDGAAVRRVPTIASVTVGDMIVSTVADQWTRLAVGANGLTLVASGGVPTWGNVTLSNVTGTLATANGGTGATTAADARTFMGIGTIATQSAGAIDISGGTVKLGTGALGDATTPPLTFNGDSDTGLFRGAANTLNVTTAGVARWDWRSDGMYVPNSADTYDVGIVGNEIRNLHFGAGVYGTEVATPSAPAANTGVIFFADNGAGKTQLQVRFPTGVVQVLATEP